MARKYLIIFSGRLRGGYTLDKVRRDLATALDMSENGARMILDRGLSTIYETEEESLARRKVKQLRDIGLEVHLEQDEPKLKDEPTEADQPTTARPASLEEAGFRIIFTGKLAQGATTLTARSRLAAALNLREDEAHRILDGGPATIFETADREAAYRKLEEFKAAGLEVRLEGDEDRDSEAEEDRSVSGEVWAGELRPLAFEFTGRGGEYFRIWLVNALLSILTLGIYSAWAKVRRRRYFYANTKLDGSTFEYLADPKGILKGRVFVAVILFFMWGLDVFWPIIGTAVGLAFWLLFPWLVVKSLRFNYGNTAYRNIRFGFKASYGQAFMVFVLWPIVGLFSLGIFWPMVYKMQQDFLVDNTSYGQTMFQLRATGGQFYKMSLGAILYLILALIVGWLVRSILAAAQVPLTELVLPLSVYLFLFAYFSVKRTNLLFNYTILGRHFFKSDQKVGSFWRLLVGNSIMTAVTLGLFHAWARVRTARYKALHLQVLAKGGLDDFIAAEQIKQAAFGEEMADMLDFDFGL